MIRRAGERMMTDYRAYLLCRDGHIFKSVELRCANDDEAMEKAQSLAAGCPVELWQLGRMVVTVHIQKKGCQA